MRIRPLLAALLLAVLASTACAAPEPEIPLSAEAEVGREVARSSGCSSCHGKNGQGVTAPTWQGLYNTRVLIQDGTTVLADDDYLFESITDPQAIIRKDWTLKMPKNNLEAQQVESIIAYIKELQ